MPQNWIYISKFLSFKEKIIFSFLIFIIIGGFISWGTIAYFSLTKPVAKQGGSYTEGIIGQPLYVNPLLSQSSETDADLTRVIYSGLLKLNGNGNLIGDLAKSWDISSDQKTYTLHLKENAVWHDGEKLNADDVFFTISILRDPAYKSPLRYNWQGVAIKQIDDHTLAFELKKSYFGFLNNLTVGILPKHIWENVAPEKFALADYNLEPVGSGPYKFYDFQKDSSGNILSYELRSFENYFSNRPYISKITFNFYPNEDSAIEAYNKKEILGISGISPEKISRLKTAGSAAIYEIAIPRYFSVFFNQNKSVALADSEVRKALVCAVNRQEIIEKVLSGKGVNINSPFLPQMKEYAGDIERCDSDIEEANKILEEAGWKLSENGIREKDGTKLEFRIFTTDWPELAQTADILKSQWKEIGASAEVNVLTISDLQQNYIRPREYDALLFGQATSLNPDPCPFWCSSQKRDPGLNLSFFGDDEVDKILEEAREISDENERIEKYRRFQEIIKNKNPAAFLYSPLYLYSVNRQVKGLELKSLNAPSQRFSEINKWYVKTKRVRK